MHQPVTALFYVIAGLPELTTYCRVAGGNLSAGAVRAKAIVLADPDLFVPMSSVTAH